MDRFAHKWETRLPHDKSADQVIWFESWPGTGGCVPGKDSLTVPLFTKMYKWVPANVMLGVTL